MKPFAEQMETSGMNSSDGEHENLQWRLLAEHVEVGQATSLYLLIPRGGGLLPEKLSRGVRPASQNSCPIYDQNLRFSLPYL